MKKNQPDDIYIVAKSKLYILIHKLISLLLSRAKILFYIFIAKFLISLLANYYLYQVVYENDWTQKKRKRFNTSSKKVDLWE